MKIVTRIIIIMVLMLIGVAVALRIYHEYKPLIKQILGVIL